MNNTLANVVDYGLIGDSVALKRGPCPVAGRERGLNTNKHTLL